MKSLIQLTLTQKKHLPLVLLAMGAMLLTTLGAQLEIITIGILTKTGPTIAIAKDPTQKGLIDHALSILSPLGEFASNPPYLAALILSVALFNAVTMFIHRYANRRISILISRDLRERYFDHVQSLSMSFFDRHSMGELSSRVVSDAVTISDAINGALVNYLQTPFRVISTLILCFFASWKLTLLILIGLPVIFWPILFISQHIRRITKKMLKNQEVFSSVLIDFLGGIQTIKIFGQEPFSQKKYQEENEKMASLQLKAAKYDNASRPIVHTIAMAFLSVVLLFGLYGLKMEISEVFVYAGLLYLFYEPIKRFAETNAQIQRGITAAERMEEVMQIQPDIKESREAHFLSHFTKEIRFDDVWFKYGDEWILKGLSFTLKKGETVALVGPTGAGKSTIAQLLLRLYDPQKGQITVDGIPLKEIKTNSLRSLITAVPQKPFLFYDTIEANIAFGLPLTREAVIDAARKAHAQEFIERLPLGYETPLAEMGKNLSGGQQQRLAIARALAKQTPILVLDEATSSLDTVSENHIKKAVQELRGEVTQLIIAHRLTTVEDADKIIYLEKGEVVGEGPLSSLIKSCPPFKLMWEMRSKSHV